MSKKKALKMFKEEIEKFNYASTLVEKMDTKKMYKLIYDHEMIIVIPKNFNLLSVRFEVLAADQRTGTNFYTDTHNMTSIKYSQIKEIEEIYREDLPLYIHKGFTTTAFERELKR